MSEKSKSYIYGWLLLISIPLIILYGLLKHPTTTDKQSTQPAKSPAHTHCIRIAVQSSDGENKVLELKLDAAGGQRTESVKGKLTTHLTKEGSISYADIGPVALFVSAEIIMDGCKD